MTAGGVLPPDWAVPTITPLNEAWFTSGALAIQRCASCGTRQHPPEEVCHSCLGRSFTHDEVAPTGTVYSYTVVHHAATGALASSVPYTVVLVSLDEAPEVRVVGNLLEDASVVGGVRIGMPVVAEWEQRVAEDGREVLLPQWRAAS